METYIKKGASKCRGKNEFKQGGSKILELCQISGLQVKSSAVNRDHEFKK